MRALQALVVFLGILIVAGLVLVVVLMVQGPRHPPAAAVTAATVGSAMLPKGFRIVDMVASADRVVVRLDAPNGRQRLVILDPASGSIVGTLETTPGAP